MEGTAAARLVGVLEVLLEMACNLTGMRHILSRWFCVQEVLIQMACIPAGMHHILSRRFCVQEVLIKVLVLCDWNARSIGKRSGFGLEFIELLFTMVGLLVIRALFVGREISGSGGGGRRNGRPGRQRRVLL
jgi:hypothetical protein